MAKAIKVIFNALKSLSAKKIWTLTKMVVSHPLFAILSLHATIKAFTLAKLYYPKTNSSNGKGNAFRHALWCCLILSYCCKISSPEKALKWCKEITDMHEELFPNEPLETKMDLHNNAVGMDLFMEMLPGIHRQFFENSFFIEALQEKVNFAKVIKNLDDHYPNELVYLEN